MKKFILPESMRVLARRSQPHLSAAPSETRLPCGCGLSRTFPFCDGTQMIADTNEPKRLVRCGSVNRHQDRATGSLVA